MEEFTRAFLSVSLSTREKESMLIRSLKELSLTTDVSIFEPTGCLSASKFYICTQKLLSESDTDSLLAWETILMLKVACKNPSVPLLLRDNYCFPPALVKFLHHDVQDEKMCEILDLLCVLTRGMTVQWGDLWVSELMRMLGSYVLNEECPEKLYDFSLTIFINLCHKSPLAVIDLLRVVPNEKFYEVLWSKKEEALELKAFMLFHLIAANSQHPTQHLNPKVFFPLLLNGVVECFCKGDLTFLQQIVDFFLSLKTQDASMFLQFDKHGACINALLNEIDSKSDPQLVGQALKLICVYASLPIPILNKEYHNLAQVVVQWISDDTAACDAYHVLMELVKSYKIKEEEDDFLLFMKDALPLILEVGSREITPQECKRMYTQLKLIEEMCSSPALSEPILEHLTPDLFVQMLDLLFTGRKEGNITCDCPDQAFLVVESLYLMSILAYQSEEWSDLYSDKSSDVSLLKFLAVALLKGEESIKQQVLELIGSIREKESKHRLAVCITECCKGNISVLSFNPNKAKVEQSSSFDSLSIAKSPVTAAQGERIDGLIAALEGKSIEEWKPSQIVELYEYKLIALKHSCKQVKADLNHSKNNNVELHHRLVETQTELLSTQRMMCDMQATMDASEQEKKWLRKKIDSLEHQNQDAGQKFMEEREALNNQVAYLEENHALIKKEMDYKLRESEEKNNQLIEQIQKMKEMFQNLQEKLESFSEENENLKKKIINLKKELNSLELTCKSQTKTIAEKDKKLKEVNSELDTLRKIQETISKLTSRK